MSVEALAALLIVVQLLAAGSAWLAADLCCRARWRRYRAAGSLPLHGHAPGPRQGRRRHRLGAP